MITCWCARSFLKISHQFPNFSNRRTSKATFVWCNGILRSIPFKKFIKCQKREAVIIFLHQFFERIQFYHNCVTSKFQFMLVRIQRNNVGSVLNHQKPTFILIPFYHNTDISSTLPSLFICFRAEPLPAGDGIIKPGYPPQWKGSLVFYCFQYSNSLDKLEVIVLSEFISYPARLV